MTASPTTGPPITVRERASSRLRFVPMIVMLLLTSACVPSVGGAGKTEVTAYFDTTAGLFVGNDVGVLGVTIGTITAIEPQGTTVKVTMEVEGDRKIPVDAQAVVVPRSVATDRYVELTPVYTGGPELEDGAEIRDTRNPVEFDEVLAALNDFATGIAGSKKSTDAIKRIIDDGSAALDGKGQLVNDTTRDLAGAVGDLSGQRKDVSAVIRSLDGLVGTLAENESTTREFITQVGDAADLLDDEKVEFRRALRNLDRAVTTIATFATDHRDEIVQVLGSGSKLLRTLDSKQKALAEILEVFPLALQNLQRAGAGDTLVVRTSPTVLLPLGNAIQQLCQDLPLGLCDLINGSDPTTRSSGGAR